MRGAPGASTLRRLSTTPPGPAGRVGRGIGRAAGWSAVPSRTLYLAKTALSDTPPPLTLTGLADPTLTQCHPAYTPSLPAVCTCQTHDTSLDYYGPLPPRPPRPSSEPAAGAVAARHSAPLSQVSIPHDRGLLGAAYPGWARPRQGKHAPDPPSHGPRAGRGRAPPTPRPRPRPRPPRQETRGRGIISLKIHEKRRAARLCAGINLPR